MYIKYMFTIIYSSACQSISQLYDKSMMHILNLPVCVFMHIIMGQCARVVIEC